jgi:peptide/nickel transport system substrate-binding protein
MNLYNLRENIWNYPYYVFFGRDSFFGKLGEFYANSRPFSYIFTTVLICVLLGYFFSTDIAKVLGFKSNTYIEGVITGTLPSGRPVGPTNLNPLQTSNPQIDRDIIELVYEPLIRVKKNGEIEKVLVDEVSKLDEDGRSFRFRLKDDVYWQDGTKFTTEDVRATFDTIKELGSAGVPEIYAGEAAKNINLKVLDEHIFEFTIDKEVLPNFYELMTFKILPAHKIDQYKNAILQSTGWETINSLGTGPYALKAIRPDEVELTANPKYHGGVPKIDTIKLKLLKDQSEAVAAVRSGQIHGISNLNTDLLSSIREISNIGIIYSDPIPTQYFGLYFNLADGSNSNLHNNNIRTAISYAINREFAVKNIYPNAEVTYSPIPSTSEYFNREGQQPAYNPARANDLLDREGWTMKQTRDPVTSQLIRTREKDGKLLSLKISYVINPDRQKLIDFVISDLKQVGIDAMPDAVSPQAHAQKRSAKDFDLILLGVSTFVDPDRYEFFHSSQIPTADNNFQGLNIASYISKEKVTRIDPQKKDTAVVPIVDDLLDSARKTSDKATRIDKYAQFQKVIADEVPLIFLYQPTINYALNNRVKNVNIADIRLLEDRFHNVQNWEIDYN